MLGRVCRVQGVALRLCCRKGSSAAALLVWDIMQLVLLSLGIP